MNATEKRRKRLRRALGVVVLLVGVYLLIAYVVAPALWRHYEHYPPMQAAPKTTLTGTGSPGDPLNVALAGEREELIQAMIAAGWFPADPETFKSGLKIAAAVLADRPYPEAPVSKLFLFGRKEDMAFEQPAGKSPRHRHHVRFWKSKELSLDGRPVWLGAATYDRSVGFSHHTGQITHHIAPDIDAERDRIVADLRDADQLVQVFQVTGVGPTLDGRNGGGDWYYTDGEMTVGVIASGNVPPREAPDMLANPAAVQFKNNLWEVLKSFLPSNPTDEPSAATKPASTAPRTRPAAGTP